MKTGRDHRWSGWPGAWCLDCGKADMLELGLSSQCRDCRASEGEDGTMIFVPCLFHSNPPCREPGSRKHEPGYKPLQAEKAAE